MIGRFLAGVVVAATIPVAIAFAELFVFYFAGGLLIDPALAPVTTVTPASPWWVFILEAAYTVGVGYLAWRIVGPRARRWFVLVGAIGTTALISTGVALFDWRGPHLSKPLTTSYLESLGGASLAYLVALVLWIAVATHATRKPVGIDSTVAPEPEARS